MPYYFIVITNNKYFMLSFILDKMKHLQKYIIHKIGPKNAVLVASSMIIILFVCYYIYRTMFYTRKETFKSNGSGSDKQAELMLFYATWCPACTAFKPQWESLKEQMHGKQINGTHIIFTEIDCSDNKNSEIEKKMQQFNITGFPSIILLHNGRKIAFDGSRSKENVSAFLNENL